MNELDSLRKLPDPTKTSPDKVLYFVYKSPETIAQIPKYTNLRYLYGIRALVKDNEFCGLKNLNGLGLYTGRSYPCLKDFYHIQALDLWGLDPYLPEYLFNFKNLLHLTLSFHRIRYISSRIKELKKLEFLSLGLGRVRYFPKNICELSNLYSLDIVGNRSIKLPLSFIKLKELTITLDLSNDENIQILSQMKQLEKLTVYMKRLGKHPKTVKELSFIKKIQLNVWYKKIDRNVNIFIAPPY
ncbi:leucine-rich repeat domain-containing protein [Microscilla marina]|nr:hypothetical protein [Microscilla marina]